MTSISKRDQPNALITLISTALIFLSTLQILDTLCLSSDLPKGVRLSHPCDYHSRNICLARCVISGKLTWKKPVRCMPHGKWSPLPNCQTSPSLKMIHCKIVTDLTQGNSEACFKFKITVPNTIAAPEALCPKILRLLVKSGNCYENPEANCAISCRNNSLFLACLVKNRLSSECTLHHPALCPELRYTKLVNCSRIPGVTCKVHCPTSKISYEKTLCLPTYEWSHLPSCDFRSRCTKQKLPAKLRFLDRKCKRSRALFCKVGCMVQVFSPMPYHVSHKIAYIKNIQCTSSGEWRGLPNCERVKMSVRDGNITKIRCAKPKLNKHSSLQGKCSYLEGSICRYKCEKGFVSKGNYTIRCWNKKWHGIQNCEPVTCPKLPNIYALKNKCQMVARSVCEIECKFGQLVGQSTIICYPSGYWSSVPLCVPSHTCSREISPSIAFVSKCSFKEGDICQVRCQGELILVGSPLIKCRRLKWWGIPECLPEDDSPYKSGTLKCPFPPRLDGNIKIIGFCKPVGGFSCDVGCRDPSARMSGPNAITCLPPGHWSFSKPCSGGKPYCSVTTFDQVEMLEHCSGKEVGSKCEVQCKHRPNMKFSVICTHEAKWSTPPNCTCPTPVLKEGIELEENCDTKQIGEKCKIRCKVGFLLVGVGIVTCSRMLQWSPLPLCEKLICPKPKLTSNLIFKDDCSAIKTGESCNLECKEGGKILDYSKIKCNDGKHWTELPSCACPPPVLNKDMEVNQDCKEKIPGQNCFVSCRGNLFLVGKNYIMCQNNTKWSKYPLCERRFCPEPVLTDLLIFDEDCSLKEFGERCRVSCKNLGNIIGSAYIVCLNTSLWSSFPNCSCPSPSLPDFLETKENCSQKLPGNKCTISCANDMIMEGNSMIKCQNNGLWSSLPKCKPNYCIKKQLPRNLLYSTDCTATQPREKCFIECKEGGEIEGDHFITCIGGSQWTDFPECLCPVPKLSSYLSATNDCSRKRIGENCPLRCSEYYHLEGKKSITCQSNTRWSPLPKCKPNLCIKLMLPSILIYAEDCTAKVHGEHCNLECTEGGKIIGKDRITCINGTTWTTLPKCTCPLPRLGDYLISTEDCAEKHVGQKCFVKCVEKSSLIGKNFITCNDNTRWSLLPKCRIQYCSRPKIPKELIYAEDCSSKIPGETCLLECTGEGELIGPNKISCINSTTWEDFPKCTCPAPFLDEDLFTAEDCFKKLIGERCYVNCKDSFQLLGKNFIICKENSRWSSSPRCRKRICPEPKLNNILVFDEDCSSKSLNETCELKCSEGGHIIGSKLITCQNKNQELYWTDYPNCTCPVPFLGEDLSATEDCHKKSIGEKCYVSCKKSFQLIGSHFIMCQKDSRWSVSPRCRKLICPEPKLNKYLTFNEDCSSKSLNESCELECSEGGHIVGSKFIDCKIKNHDLYWTDFPNCTCPAPLLGENLLAAEGCHKKIIGENCYVKCKKSLQLIGPNFVVCQNHLRWSSPPKCQKLICPEPKLNSIFTFKENCSSKSLNESCELACSEGGHIIGSKFIKCEIRNHYLHWTEFPNCTCPSPFLGEDLSATEDCHKKFIGEKCYVSCKNFLQLIGSNFITCQNQFRWSSSPKCRKLICPEPKLNNILDFHEDCSSISLNESCELECKEGGHIIGSKFITCKIKNNDIYWSELPGCTCPIPFLGKDLSTSEECSKKLIGERCYVNCRNFLQLLGPNFIICEKNSRWSSSPRCRKRVCPEPKLNSILDFHEDCSSKYLNENCELECSEGGHIIGKKLITCKIKNQELYWTDYPNCTCPVPFLGEDLSAVEDCDKKPMGEKCYVSCKKSLQLIGPNFIICQKNSRWSSSPRCRKLICPEPKLNKYLTFNEDCSSKSLNESCELECSGGGHIVGSKFIDCKIKNHDLYWTDFPNCTCPTPLLGEDLLAADDCHKKLIGEKCYVYCRKSLKLLGSNFIICQKNLRWSSKKKCKELICPEPKLNSFLTFSEDCSSKLLNETCELECSEGGYIIGSKFITCKIKTHNVYWTDFPSCTCPAPLLSENLSTTDDCRRKLVGEKCYVSCNNFLQLIGSNFIICQNQFRWSSSPRCRKRICPEPKLSSILDFHEDCSLKSLNESCELECSEGGHIIGSKFITCKVRNHELIWSNFPNCTCPAPLLSENLSTAEDCHKKLIGEKCYVTCKNSLQLRGSNFIICQKSSRWSSPPKCMKRACPEPKLNSILNFHEDCSTKFLNENCELECSEGGHIIGSKFITCKIRNHNIFWTTFPNCTCPAPFLIKDLSPTEDCHKKLIGEKCYLSCKETFQLVGSNFIICQKSSRWSSPPKCRKRICTEPKLNNVLRFRENCSSKSINEECELRCREGGEILGSKFITCKVKNHDLYWTVFPNCTCPFPVLDEDLSTTEDCRKKFIGEKCYVSCKKSLQLIGSNFITCHKQFRWSLSPRCSKRICPEPKLNNMLDFPEDCSSKSLNEICELDCKEGHIIGSKYITCKIKNHDLFWTDLPLCTCADPLMKGELKLLDGCHRKRPGEICKVNCPSKFTILGNSFIRCLNNSEWSNFPKCVLKICTKPRLPNFLDFQEDCSSKVVGESCLLKCRYGGKLLNSSHIFCLESKNWSPFQKCTCSPVTSINGVKLLEDCSQKLPGDTCNVVCRSSDSKLNKPGPMVCGNTSQWDFNPKCSDIPCSLPTLPVYLELERKCSNTTIGSSCKVKCAQWGHLLGDNDLRCTDKGFVGELPDCTCPKAWLNTGLRSTQNCDFMIHGQRCFLTCEKNMIMRGVDFIRCQDDRKWSKLPSCDRACPIPVLTGSDLKLSEDCSKKTIFDECRLVCTHGGMREKYIRCQRNATWTTTQSDCTCTLPHLPKSLEFSRDFCLFKKIGDKCPLECSGRLYKLIGPNYIECQNNRTWTSLPECELILCPNPRTIDPGVDVPPTCNSFPFGSSCYIKCKEGYKQIRPFKIRCLKTGNWSPFPECIRTVCLELPLTGGLRNANRWIEGRRACKNTKKGEKCFVTCIAGLTLHGNNFVRCQKDLTWGPQPSCSR